MDIIWNTTGQPFLLARGESSIGSHGPETFYIMIATSRPMYGYLLICLGTDTHVDAVERSLMLDNLVDVGFLDSSIVLFRIITIHLLWIIWMLGIWPSIPHAAKFDIPHVNSGSTTIMHLTRCCSYKYLRITISPGTF